MSKTHKMFDITIKIPNSMKPEEGMAYAQYVRENHPDYLSTLKLVVVKLVENDEVELEYIFDPIPFERIRRITGYLASTDKWNSAKLAELSDRVSHDV